MDENEPQDPRDPQKEGISVKDIGKFTRKNRFAVFFCIAFILACFFSFVIWYPVWSIVATIVGGIIGVLLPEKIARIAKNNCRFFLKQEKTTQLVLAIVFLILAIFVAPLYFLLLGLHGGKSLQKTVMDADNPNPNITI